MRSNKKIARVNVAIRQNVHNAKHSFFHLHWKNLSLFAASIGLTALLVLPIATANWMNLILIFASSLFAFILFFELRYSFMKSRSNYILEYINKSLHNRFSSELTSSNSLHRSFITSTTHIILPSLGCSVSYTVILSLIYSFTVYKYIIIILHALSIVTISIACFIFSKKRKAYASSSCDIKPSIGRTIQIIKSRFKDKPATASGISFAFISTFYDNTDLDNKSTFKRLRKLHYLNVPQSVVGIPFMISVCSALLLQMFTVFPDEVSLVASSIRSVSSLCQNDRDLFISNFLNNSSFRNSICVLVFIYIAMFAIAILGIGSVIYIVIRSPHFFISPLDEKIRNFELNTINEKLTKIEEQFSKEFTKKR